MFFKETRKSNLLVDVRTYVVQIALEKLCRLN